MPSFIKWSEYFTLPMLRGAAPEQTEEGPRYCEIQYRRQLDCINSVFAAADVSVLKKTAQGRGELQRRCIDLEVRTCTAGRLRLTHLRPWPDPITHTGVT